MRTRWRSPPESVANDCACRLGHAGLLQCLKCGLEVAVVRLPAAGMRETPQQHIVQHRPGKGRAFFLQQHADALRQIPARDAGQWLPVEQNAARSGFRKTAQGMDQGGLAAAVFPQDGPALAGLER